MKNGLTWGVVLIVALMLAGLANLFFGFGFGVYRIPAPSQRVKSTKGMTYRLDNPAMKREVELASLLPYLRDASWSTEHFITKMTLVVDLDDGQRMRIDAFGHHFQIDGIRGTFFVSGPGREEFDRLCDKILPP